MEGPYIKVDLLKEHEFSEQPKNAGFEHILGLFREDKEEEVVSLMERITPGQLDVLNEALNEVGALWKEFFYSVQEGKDGPTEALKNLLQDWDSIEPEERTKRAKQFAEMIRV